MNMRIIVRISDEKRTYEEDVTNDYSGFSYEMIKPIEFRFPDIEKYKGKHLVYDIITKIFKQDKLPMMLTEISNGQLNDVSIEVIHREEKYDECRITYKDALKLATEKHKGQKRWNGNDFIIHPIAVADACHTNMLKILGVSHDLLEDTKTTLKELCSLGYSQRMLEALDALTHKNDDTYMQYILIVMMNKDARYVKMRDLRHNMSDLKKGSILDKYELAYHILRSHSE